MATELSRHSRTKFLKYGVPFFILIVGGSFGFKEFTSLRYQYANKQKVSPEDVKKYGINMKSPKDVTLDSEYEKVKNIDIENWENKRGPRPWEEEF